MRGQYFKKKIKKFIDNFKHPCFEVKRFFVKRSVKNKDFTVISNNCWAGKVYQYLDMPYLSPTVGLYFFASDYLNFISDLHHYLDMPLKFVPAEESKYYQQLKERNQLDKPIGLLDDVEIVFLHYKSAQEAEEKWNRRKARVNFDNIIIKTSDMNLCIENHLKAFDSLPFNNKFILTKNRPLKHKCEIYIKDKNKSDELVNDTIPFPRNISLKKILNKPPEKYPENGFDISL